MSDTALFKNSLAKIARAREHLQGLQNEFQRFFDSKPYDLRQEHDLEAGETRLVYYPNAPIPENWSVIIGEIFFNLRSALDLAVYELTIREQGAPLKNTEFPIFDDEIAFLATKRNGDPAPGSGLFKMRGLSQKTQSVIKTLQPYTITTPDQVSILKLLHEMNITDKHRELHLCRQMAHTTRVQILEDVPGFMGFGMGVMQNLDERAVIGFVQTSAPLDDKMYVSAELVLEITFDKSCCSAFKVNTEVVKLTSQIINGVEMALNHLRTSLN